MSKGTYSFTTPLYYVNAAPHLGTAYTTIAADAGCALSAHEWLRRCPRNRHGRTWP